MEKSLKVQDKKSTKNNISRDLLQKHRKDPLQEVEPPKNEFQKKISREIDIKMVAEKVSPRLSVWDAVKKKGFKLYYNEEMPSRKMKSSLFNGKKLFRIPDDAYDVKTFWNQTVWMDPQKSSTYGYDRGDNVEHHDVIQELHPVRKNHFYDACVCFTKDMLPQSKLKHLLKLWTTLLYVGSSFTNNGVMNETPEESNAAIVDEVEHTVIELASKLSTTSNEATSRGKGEPDVVIIYSTSLGPTPLNYAQPAIVTRDQVQDMIGQAMETFVERQH
ncbi:hypothetical protein JHK84_027829 [Glycine max]|nr:hypothetical protein JHK86_027707 [Glycine max]KAG5151357.1 hypothetical protein JHK84_027829 [Glycine max]